MKVFAYLPEITFLLLEERLDFERERDFDRYAGRFRDCDVLRLFRLRAGLLVWLLRLRTGLFERDPVL